MQLGSSQLLGLSLAGWMLVNNCRNAYGRNFKDKLLRSDEAANFD